ncbi:hypothetical protein GCM10009850_097630 [Nonomuraea monospora]|uniref:Uncharacterized protein n=1 Tax=Nonomuraea monospora TaxID=568818 RepID=A0ABN3CXQ6_9ACTN
MNAPRDQVLRDLERRPDVNLVPESNQKMLTPPTALRRSASATKTSTPSGSGGPEPPGIAVTSTKPAYSAPCRHASRTSLEIYSKITLGPAQEPATTSSTSPV